jgi:pantoate kinase
VEGDHLPASEAVCPAGISSFFEVCHVDSDGKALSDPALIGARGGGFAIKRGVRAHVRVTSSKKNRIEIKINSKPAPEANTTHWALKHLLEKTGATLNVKANIAISVPIGAGYGTSAAGTAAASLALTDAAKLPLTYNELGRITHMAEVINRTGLGTAAAVFVGGFDLVTKPGAPGIGAVDRLLFPRNHSIVCAFLEPMPTRQVLSQTDIASRVNPFAQLAMERIRQTPDLHTFLREARKFGRQVGFETPDITNLIDTMMSGGAVGAVQNMIGKAVHAVVEDRKAPELLRLVKRKVPTATVFVSQLDESGVRLATSRKPKH